MPSDQLTITAAAVAESDDPDIVATWLDLLAGENREEIEFFREAATVAGKREVLLVDTRLLTEIGVASRD